MLHTMSSTGLRYCTYAGDEIAITTTAPPLVTETTQNPKGQVPAWRILNVPFDTYDCHLLIICLPNYSSEVL